MNALLRQARHLDGVVTSHPVTSSVFFGTTTKASIDYIVQRSEGDDDGNTWTYDARRGASFALFGFLYLGVTQQQIYARAFPWVLSRMAIKGRALRALVQVVFDQAVVFPVVYFPMFYGIQGLLRPQQPNAAATTPAPSHPTTTTTPTAAGSSSSSSSGHDPIAGLLAGLERCANNLQDDCTAAAVVWGPVQLANFALVPRHWRAPVVSITGFLWTAFLSATRGGGS